MPGDDGDRMISAASRAGVLAVMVVMFAFPSISRAGCGGVETAQAATHLPGQLAPLAIGDSTMLLSLPGLAADGYDANAHGCRQFSEALALLSQLRARGALPHMVTIALGANGDITASDIDQALQILCCNRLLVLVTPRQLGGSSGENAALEHAEARRHPGQILLLDWVSASAGHGDWFQPDGLHLTLPGVHAFTDLLARALPYAYLPCPPVKRSERAHALDATPAISIDTTLAHVGYIGVSIAGPPGVQVQLSEQVGGSTVPIEVVQLINGTAEVPHALPWLCDRRTRELVASALPPALPEQVTATVLTPTCTRRPATSIGRRVQVGHSAKVAVRDRWGIGGMPFDVCVTAPGARRACRRKQLPAGTRRLVIRVPMPRPGGWRITVRTAYGYNATRLVWASHRNGRIRLLAAGDSEMQILDTFLGQDLQPYGVDVTSDARISTGLTNSFFFNWQTHAREDAAGLRPDVTVIFMGANDGFSVAGPHGHPVGCCGPAWSAGYANLVAQMMTTFLRGTRGRVYWFLLPAPRPANFQQVFDGVNSGIRQAAARFPGRVGLIDANAFYTPHNRYRDYMTYHGQGFVIHEPDGVHLSTASDRISATLVLHRLLSDHVIR